MTYDDDPAESPLTHTFPPVRQSVFGGKRICAKMQVVDTDELNRQ